MSETRILYVIALTIALMISAVVHAQVPVEVSNEKFVSGGRIFFMHEVQKGQTLYSISRAYKVTIEAITRDNVIPSSGIQTGQVLRIPSGETVTGVQPQARQETRAGGTTTTISPIGASSRIDPATGIMLSRERIVFEGKAYFIHEVLKGQTLYSIARAYKVTILDIDRVNAIPAGGIQAGQTLRIPVSSSLVAEMEETVSPGDAGQKDRVSTAVESPRPAPSQPQTQMPRQESTPQTSQLPVQEKPSPAAQTGASTVTQQSPGEPEKVTGTAVTGPEPETKTQDAVTRDTPAKQAQPERKKVHKVQKGESLSDIAEKYNITVQELKQANKGVIFAMPDMRLVIPASGESGKK